MTLDQEQPPALERRSRDPERTKEEILVVATQEFAERGFAGARVDEIASQTRTTKRMIYYYYGSKERLYLAALERAYEDIRVTEASVDVEHLVQRAQFVSAASGFPGLDRPIVKMLDHALERGREQGVFVRDIDALDLHMLISSFCFFRINNRYTFAASFGRNLVEPERRTRYREMIGDVVVDYLTTPGAN